MKHYACLQEVSLALVLRLVRGDRTQGQLREADFDSVCTTKVDGEDIPFESLRKQTSYDPLGLVVEAEPEKTLNKRERFLLCKIRSLLLVPIP